MHMRRIWHILITLALSLAPTFGRAQAPTATDSILLGAVVIDTDTIPMIYLPDQLVLDRLPKKWVKRQEAFNRLKYNIQKVYPYALIAASVLKDYEDQIARLPERRDRRHYRHQVEEELKKRFKGELTNLTISQGQVLVKLINRQTGKDCYSILKDVKGGFNAVIYQSVALLFSNNLKRDYDPEGADRDMEAIVRELEATHRYQYYYYQQQQRHTRAN